MSAREKVLVTGAGGFIGSHLVTFLKRQGYWVRGVDLKYPDFTSHSADDFLLLDLRDLSACIEATREIDNIYALAADTGGSGFRHSRKVDTARTNLLINLHTLEAARIRRVKHYLYASSTSLWSGDLQLTPMPSPPDMPRSSLFQNQLASLEQQLIEHLCLHYQFYYGLDAHVIRLPTLFGPFSPWDGGREYVPAALCRKIAAAKLTQTTEVEIWGDGTQTRNFSYIDDCVAALNHALHEAHPVMILDTGIAPVTINHLADLIAQVAGISIVKRYISPPTGQEPQVDNINLPRLRSPQPQTSLAQGLVPTYAWIEERVRHQLRQRQTP
jgi:nucleoside-diphosphate-sugar epimerase